MAKKEVNNKILFWYWMVPGVFFWALALSTGLGLIQTSLGMLIFEFVLLAMSFMAINKWVKGNKIMLTEKELLIRDWEAGLYYNGFAAKVRETKFDVKNIRKIVVGKPKNLYEWGKQNNDKRLSKELLLPLKQDLSKIENVRLMYVIGKGHYTHLVSLQTYGQRAVDRLLSQLDPEKVEVEFLH